MKILLWTLVWFGLSSLDNWMSLHYKGVDVYETLQNREAVSVIMVAIWLYGCWYFHKNR